MSENRLSRIGDVAKGGSGGGDTPTVAEMTEMFELRSFLTARGLKVNSCQKVRGTIEVEVPAGQEPALREALEGWTRERVAFYVKSEAKGGGG